MSRELTFARSLVIGMLAINVQCARRYKVASFVVASELPLCSASGDYDPNQVDFISSPLIPSMAFFYLCCLLWLISLRFCSLDDHLFSANVNAIILKVQRFVM